MPWRVKVYIYIYIYKRTDNVIGEVYPGLNCRYNIHTDTQCVYNLTLRSVGATTVAMEKRWVLCVCSLRYLTCTKHAPYLNLRCSIPKCLNSKRRWRSVKHNSCVWRTFTSFYAPYCHLWPAPLYNIFPHYLTKVTIFEKKKLNTKCVFWYSLQLLSETFPILRRTERDVNRNVYRSSWKVPVIVVRF